jgi:hypothetical protein
MIKTAVILATGPSLTEDVVSAVRQGQKQGKWSVYGMNHTWKIFPTLNHFHACNKEYYDCEWGNGLDKLPCTKTTIDIATANKYGIKYINGKWADGFSSDPEYVHYGHSSGFQLPQIAYNNGFKRLLLCGYDMRFASDYNGKNERIGSAPRHFFGEYHQKELKHWPSVKIKDGVFIELIQQFENVKIINTDVNIINCSPGSAMTCFPFENIINV